MHQRYPAQPPEGPSDAARARGPCGVGVAGLGRPRSERPLPPPRRPGEGWHAVVSGIRRAGCRSWQRSVGAPDRALHRAHSPEPAPGWRPPPGWRPTSASTTSSRNRSPWPLITRCAPSWRCGPRTVPLLVEAFGALYAAGLPLGLPGRQLSRAGSPPPPAPSRRLPGCFGGTTLAFVEPDGSVWDCPSRYRIAATAGHRTSKQHRRHHRGRAVPARPRPVRVTARSTRTTASTCGRLSMTSTASSPPTRPA